jgi:P27 family predicted phage terminase small subunit
VAAKFFFWESFFVMGRRPDPPELQAQKGYPGKRRKLTKARAAQAAALAERLAAAPPADDGAFAAPRWMDDPALAPAQAIWADVASRLDEIHLINGLDRHTLAIYCVYMAEWIEANDALQREPYCYIGTSTSGGVRPWTNPNAKRRDAAAGVIFELTKRFGFSPLDRFALIKDRSASAVDRGAGLFNRDEGAPVVADAPQAPEAPAAPSVDPVDEALLGLGARLNSNPPTMQ